MSAVRPKVVQAETRGHRLGGIDRHERQHAAGHAAGGDGGQPAGGLLVELGGKVGDDQHAIGLGHLAGHGVVGLDGGVLVAQVLLRHGLHVRFQLGQSLLDLARIGPDLVGDEGRIEVGQVHERTEVAADADRIDDREPDHARRQAGQDAKHRGLEHRQRRGSTLGGGLDQEVGRGGKRPQGGSSNRGRGRPSAGRRRRLPEAGRRGRPRQSPCG